ncbi:MAG: SUMF1/EgtB/PvdO family nonheme iron enzyme [Acidobacteriia bacterium]|nr:SUMF1/EgtB/PvdO family nonheme iron enzyme [Terriglobia bacterium]
MLIAPLFSAWPVWAAVDFVRQVKPLLETACLDCHGEKKSNGGLQLHTRKHLFEGAFKGRVLVPGKPDQSLLYTLTLLRSGVARAMPPGGPALTGEEKQLLRQWILEGAVWPEEIMLGPPKTNFKDDLELTRELHRRITAIPVPHHMEPYKETIPGSSVTFAMVPIPGGEFTMGTPDSEPGHRKDESPQHKMKIEPFWMGKHEVSWDEYRLFMYAKNGVDPAVDAVSRPTRAYVEMSFGMGINGFPAISMTHHAANKYAEWLSARTGQFFRLPTEAEWEYACRAGSEAAYSFGSEASRIGEYAWYGENSNGKYQQVGAKKPNAWGLHDMHGNVMEWTLDQYAQYAPDTSARPLLDWVRSTKPYPHVARGGSWNDDQKRLRCGARAASDQSWKMQDPQLPKSIWYHTDAQWLGFRLVRPLRTPSAEQMQEYWNNKVEKE